MIEPIRAYLALLDAPPSGTAERITVMATALDRLALAFTTAAEAPYVDGEDPPDRGNYKQAYTRIGAAFPDLGYYAVVEPVADPEAKLMMGDAIDDLVDIAADLRQVVWLWDKRRQAEATWLFQFGYRSHWGAHLHELRRYVHQRYLDSRTS